MNTKIKNESNEKFLDDRVVTKLFRDKDCRDYLIAVISAALKIDKKIIEDIAFVNPKVSSNINYKDGEADVVMENDYVVINVEINRHDYKEVEAKNTSYLFHLFLKTLDIGEKYNPKEIFQININNYDRYGKNEFIYESCIMEKKYHIEVGKLRIVDINVAKLRKMDYNEIKKEDKESLERLLYVLVNNNKEELEKVYGEDKMMKKVNDKLEKLTEGYDDRLYYNRDELYRLGAYNEGKAEGHLEIAKSMLKDEMDINIIAKYTDLTIEELEKLKAEIQK